MDFVTPSYYLYFLPIVFILTIGLASKRRRAQILILLSMSYVFFWLASGWHIILLLISTCIDWTAGQRMQRSEDIQYRKRWLKVSLITNLSILGIFKYLDFLIESFNLVSLKFTEGLDISTFDLALPVGISFYTFQTMSYTIDIFRKKQKPYDSFLDFACYAAFFPQLVAGPIERASNLLPQFFKARSFDYYQAVDGMRQILWGLFKKAVIADNCAVHANEIFNNSGDYSGAHLFLGAFFFAFQIYGDFSGYSDIAIGTSRLFGFDLMQNFNFPYFSRDIAEFWRRWHISLSTWFRDYLYIPLGGSRGGTWMKVRNTFIIFIVSGFWHGANWTFIVWGVLNAIYFLPLLLTNSNRNNLATVAQGKLLPSIKELLFMSLTFGLTVFTWIFFRSENIGHAISYISEIFSPSLLSSPYYPGIGLAIPTIILTVLFVLIEWFGREGQFAISHIGQKWYRPLRWTFYSLLIFIIGMFFGIFLGTLNSKDVTKVF